VTGELAGFMDAYRTFVVEVNNGVVVEMLGTGQLLV